MGRAKAKAAANEDLPELWRMWRALLRGRWSSIVVVPTAPGTSARGVVQALEDLAREQDVGPFQIIDAEGASMVDGPRIASAIRSSGDPKVRKIVLVDSLVLSLCGAPIVAAVDAALLVIPIGADDPASMASTIQIVGQDRILGYVAVEARWSK